MIILGVAQGATEFLPVSSSGHLTILQDVLNITENRILFDIFLHLGTLIAICVFFAKDIVALVSSKRKWIPYLILASVPAGLVGFTLRSPIEKVFDSTLLVAALLIGNGFILIVGSKASKRGKGLGQVGVKSSLWVGTAQCLAILPGISRSGTTVCSGLLLGWERRVAVLFSFLLAIPVMIGAAGVEIVRSPSVLQSHDVLVMAITGIMVSALTGYGALRLFLKAVENEKLWLFAVYCFAIGTGVILFKLVS